MKIFSMLLFFHYVFSSLAYSMFRVCYIKNNVGFLGRKKANSLKFIKQGLKVMSTSLHYNDDVKNFYGINEKGFNNNEPPPYLLQFENSNDILTYTKDIDNDCLNQIKNLAKLKIVKGHIAILPDVHLGKGIIIGSVFLTKDFIIPNGVGVDIGCGILCLKINNLKKKNLNDKNINNIYNMIKRNIPLSFDYHDKEIFDSKMRFDQLIRKHGSKNISSIIKSKHFKQLGTLGGGNHFIEIGYDASSMSEGGGEKVDRSSARKASCISRFPNDHGGRDSEDDAHQDYEESDIYVLIHSGSRNIGKTTAEFYDVLASEESKMKRNDLAYLDLRKEDGQNYLKDMKLCLEYAKCNRIYMMKIIEKVIYDEVKCTLNWENCINIHHNFCNHELVSYVDNNNEIKKEYMFVTRKGATSSKKDELGIIPGNMKVGSYIVKGKGNMLSYSSCSHGCGRILSRTKAKQLIHQNDFVNIMRGIRCDTNNKIRDEAPQAYKNLNDVLKNQDSLIHVVKRLIPLINIKGF
ncbi:tRNA-splicing ligase RtcB, putative [Plasmodium ovale]|uniref:3'-phosphate/5'-hydroxy nucleic acid ligase n=2 Tax=Plasmodium ovale TaxID=36330 RepID=A0A1D3UA72_PLAOA|nr:tRNA-splicing ligase RtcB, putative [Plasmodium ovale]